MTTLREKIAELPARRRALVYVRAEELIAEENLARKRKREFKR
jgi:hypothetical protein